MHFWPEGGHFLSPSSNGLIQNGGVPMTSIEQSLKPSRNNKTRWLHQLHWMTNKRLEQEATRLTQAQQKANNISVLDYTANVFGPTNIEQEEEGQEIEEDDGSEEMDFAEDD
ncbi:hypothetical protein Goshw_019971 [Gossypium schwendimanii]|uniref:Uncharacterized protein n=1 Tax=Gossypium schwendimanii TaxID=34291 RepID=A0A7J9N7H6_GOSSC|nr:hypothetical protein [Gossypium schwendimanii]